MSMKANYRNVKSLKGNRSSQAVSASDLRGLLASLGTQGLTLNNVTLTNVQVYSGYMDDVAIGNSQPSTGIFTRVQVGDDTGIGGELVAYGNKPGDMVRWDPVTSQLNIAGAVTVRDPVSFGNIQIKDNDIRAINKDGDVNIIPNSANAAVKIAGNIQQSVPGSVLFEQSTVIKLESQTDASLTSRNATCLLYTSPSPRDRQKSRMPSSA